MKIWSKIWDIGIPNLYNIFFLKRKKKYKLPHDHHNRPLLAYVSLNSIRKFWLFLFFLLEKIISPQFPHGKTIIL